MKTEAVDIVALKVGAVFSAIAGFAGGAFAPGVLIPFFNVSLTTLGMAAAGSLLAFAYGTPIKEAKRLYGYAVGGVFIAVWSIHLLRWRGIDLSEEVAGPVAGFISLGSRWVIPLILDNLPALWELVVGRIFGVTKSTGDRK